MLFRSYNSYLKTASGYASSLKACTYLYDDGVKIFIDVYKRQEYTIVAVLKTDIQKLSFNRTVFADDGDFLSFQKELLAQPLYHDPAFIPGAGHRLLTLVTCSYEWDNARTVVCLLYTSRCV